MPRTIQQQLQLIERSRLISLRYAAGLRDNHSEKLIALAILTGTSLEKAAQFAVMSEMYYGTIAPHNPLGPISLAACIQLDACTPNFLIQEHPGNPDKSDLGVGYIKEPFVIKDGYIEVSDKPGLGVELDDDALKDKIYDGKWTTPRQYFEDGSNADW